MIIKYKEKTQTTDLAERVTAVRKEGSSAARAAAENPAVDSRKGTAGQGSRHSPVQAAMKADTGTRRPAKATGRRRQPDQALPLKRNSNTA